MKSLLESAFFCFVFAVLAASACAQNRHEAGIVLGNPSGFSGKFFLNDKNAIDVVAGLDRGMSVHTDYLWHDFEVFEVNEGAMPLYYGVGVLFTDKGFYLQGKIGLEYLFETNPLGIFIEAAPAVGPDFRFQGGIGVRYRLK